MAAVSKIGFMIYVAIASLVCSNFISTASAQCKGDFQGLVQQCSRYVQKSGPQTSPSQQCCILVRNLDLPCVCQHVTTQAENIISMKKATFVAAFCGKPLAPGTKCGSYTVPRLPARINF